MKIDFNPFFKKYEIIASQVDGIVTKIQEKFPKLIACKPKCVDCCSALFDLSFIEALYLNNHFNIRINTEKKSKILENSNIIDRKIHKLKKKAYNSVKKGEKSSGQILYEMATAKIECPLLNTHNLCELYSFRPITCRTYGLPISFAGKSHTCGLSGFKTGSTYPTIRLDNIHENLYLLSKELVIDLKSKYIRMAEVLMPVSMALLTTFDETYLGLIDKEN